MATHSCVLAWRTPGTGEPGGLSMGSHRVGQDCVTKQQQGIQHTLWTYVYILLEKAMAPSTLAWKNPMDRGAW